MNKYSLQIGTNWYSKALASSTDYSWTISSSSSTSDSDDFVTNSILQLSKRFDDSNGNPYVVTCVELNLTYFQYHTLNQFTYNTGNVTGIMLASYWGNVFLWSSGIGKTLLTTLSQTTVNSNGTYSVSASDWVEPQRVAELQDSDTFTWTDSDSESYHVSASKLNLSLDTSVLRE